MGEQVHPGKFTGPVGFGPVTLDLIMLVLGVADRPEAEQRAAVARARQQGKLPALYLACLRDTGWID